MDQPLVSVAMITYNHAPYIARAIEGVINQRTSFPVELVIGEDHSTDGTREIVLEYARRYPDLIHVVKSDHNLGASENSNRTLVACRGRYIAFCEGDDFWHRDDKLELQVNYLNSHHDCELVCSDLDRLDQVSGDLIESYVAASGLVPPDPVSIIDVLSPNGSVHTCTVLASRELIFRIKNADPYLHSEGRFKMGDRQLWAEAATLTRIRFMTDSLATYRYLPESASRSKDKRRLIEFWISSVEMRLYLCEKHKLPNWLRQRNENRLTNLSLKLAFQKRDSQLARNVQKAAGRLSMKDRFWYLGATVPVVRPVVGLLDRLFH